MRSCFSRVKKINLSIKGRPISIEQIIERVPEWRGQASQVEPIRVGRTNTNFKVTVNDQSYFVRTPGPGTDLLDIDRQNEFFNIQQAAALGIAPQGLYFFKADGVLVLEFIPAKLLSVERLQQVELQQRLIEVVKVLHAGPRQWRDFNMFRTIENYLKVAQARGFDIPSDYLNYLAQVKEIEQVLLADPAAPPQRPCHNDLAPENILDDGHNLILVDFDYSGNNDPCFELGNFCVQLNYDEAQLRHLVSAYFGRLSESKVARTQLQGLMSDIGWTLWCAIKAKVTTIDFDFWDSALRRWHRARQKMESPEFETWLRQVRQGD